MFGWRAAVPALKHCMTIRALADLMWSDPDPSEHDDPDARIARIGELTLTGGRLLVSRNCLTRSLVTYRLLSRAGATPVLLLGAAMRAGDTTAGHAWLEVGGRPFPAPDDETYEPIVRFTARRVQAAPAKLRGRPA